MNLCLWCQREATPETKDGKWPACPDHVTEMRRNTQGERNVITFLRFSVFAVLLIGAGVALWLR